MKHYQASLFDDFDDSEETRTSQSRRDLGAVDAMRGVGDTSSHRLLHELLDARRIALNAETFSRPRHSPWILTLLCAMIASREC